MIIMTMMYMMSTAIDGGRAMSTMDTTNTPNMTPVAMARMPESEGD